jgi:hypothetical protein
MTLPIELTWMDPRRRPGRALAGGRSAGYRQEERVTGR